MDEEEEGEEDEEEERELHARLEESATKEGGGSLLKMRAFLQGIPSFTVTATMQGERDREWKRMRLQRPEDSYMNSVV